ncbi:maltose permease [Ilyonectria robusta]|uniref:maltose permease n=1 Tax=Ilyonectria robusta TaxID=1079257 RepID=UPI001E8D4F2E|nr:maltose permease [Ilyonectria robusta]KAH8686459.1 maltose permease [Ilyonectria robusta]
MGITAEAKAKNDVSQLEDTGAAAFHTTPDHAEEKLTFRDFWEHRRVLGFCFIIYLLPINFGYEVSMVGKLFAVTPFAQHFGYEVDGVWVVKATDQQLVNAASTIGLFTSAFATGIISDYIGRKKTIVMACFICISGVILQYFSTTIYMIFGGKLLSTLGFGLGHSLGPVFVAELAPTKMRGVCLVLINTTIVMGQWLNSLVVYFCKNYEGDMAWRIPIITQVCPPGLLLLALAFLPESPTWLLINGRHEEAAKSYRRFNGANFDVDAAVEVATVAIAKEEDARKEQEGSSWLECFKGTNRRRTLIIVMVYISQQFIGVNFISGYLTYYFRLAGVNDPLALGQIANAIQLFGNICSWPLVDRLGRRPMIVGGYTIMSGLLLVIGGISTIGTSPSLLAQVALMCVWGFLYQATLGAVAYAIGGETASVRLRQKTYSINIMVATAFSCLITQVMPYLLNTDQANLGGKISFVFFGLSVPVLIYLYFCLPELKGRNYAEVQEMFENKVPARKFKTYKCDSALLEHSETKKDLEL